MQAFFLLDLTEPNTTGRMCVPASCCLAAAPLPSISSISRSISRDRIVCLVNTMDPQLLPLQHRSERAGRLFHTITSPRELSALVTANDEVIMLTEGLMADRERALNVLETGTGVFVQPVEAGLAAGFERLDINNASAGMLRIPGRLIESLAQLSEDYAVGSALSRIALQDGIPMREVAAEARSGLRWLMIRSESEAYAVEHDWLAQQLGQSQARSPGNWLASQGVLSFGPSLLARGQWLCDHAGRDAWPSCAGAGRCFSGLDGHRVCRVCDRLDILPHRHIAAPESTACCSESGHVIAIFTRSLRV